MLSSALGSTLLFRASRSFPLPHSVFETPEGWSGEEVILGVGLVELLEKPQL